MAYDENVYARIINGDLSEKEIIALKASGEWAEIQKILELTDGYTIPAMDKDRGYKNLVAAREIKLKKFSKKNNRRYLWMGLAASFSLVIAMLFLFNEQTIEINAALAETKDLLLPDGSEVKLNAGSKVEYSHNDWTNNRVLKLTGEAFFTVEQGSSFEVRSENGTVQVVGTAFNVRTWGAKLYVECYEGQVNVKSRTATVSLAQGQSVSIHNGELQEQKSIPNNKPVWTEGVSRFYQENLNQVFLEMERQYGLSVKSLKDDRLFSGSFNHDNLEQALNQVCNPMNLKYKLEGQNKVIISR